MRNGPRAALALMFAITLVGSGAAAAGQTPAAAMAQGPLVLAPISSRIVFSPDVKITTVNDRTSTLAGVYAGKRIEDRFLVGFGGYWLADPRSDARLFYAGLLTGWRVIGNARFSLDARMLAGAGQGTVFQTTAFARPDFRTGDQAEVDRRVGFRDDFWVAEPQVVFDVSLTDFMHVNLGAGYRATTAQGGFNELFRGATGNIGVEFYMGK